MPAGGPWVNVAAICEDFEQDLFGTLTLRGLSAGVTVGVSAEAVEGGTPMVAVQVVLAVVLSGGEPGSYVALTVAIVGEDGRREIALGAGASRWDADGLIQQPFRIAATFWGAQRYWFDVLLDDELVTRAPLTVHYQALPPLHTGLPE